MNGKSHSPISRREFARRAAIVSAASFVPPSALLANSDSTQPAAQQPLNTSSLSPESQAEADARYKAILAIYGARFSDTQKAELQRLSFLAQPPLDRIRAFEIKNGDAPALYLKPLVEREKPSTLTPNPQASNAPAKKP